MMITSLMGLTICYYILMRGFVWIIEAKEAPDSKASRERRSLGIMTVLGAAIFAMLWLASGLTGAGFSKSPSSACCRGARHV